MKLPANVYLLLYLMWECLNNYGHYGLLLMCTSIQSMSTNCDGMPMQVHRTTYTVMRSVLEDDETRGRSVLSDYTDVRPRRHVSLIIY